MEIFASHRLHPPEELSSVEWAIFKLTRLDGILVWEYECWIDSEDPDTVPLPDDLFSRERYKQYPIYLEGDLR